MAVATWRVYNKPVGCPPSDFGRGGMVGRKSMTAEAKESENSEKPGVSEPPTIHPSASTVEPAEPATTWEDSVPESPSADCDYCPRYRECYYERGYRLAYSLTRNHHDAEDVLQDALVSCRRHCQCKHGVRCCDCRICRHQSWCCGECCSGWDCIECRSCRCECWRRFRCIIRMRANDFLKKESRRRKLEVDILPDEISCCKGSCHRLCCNCSVHCDVRDAVHRLRNDHRDVILLWYWHGLRPTEIAERLRTTQYWVRERHKEAKKILRKTLGCGKLECSCDCRCWSGHSCCSQCWIEPSTMASDCLYP